MISGSGSLWSNEAAFVVGHNGSDNVMSVNSGGNFYSGAAEIGEQFEAERNLVKISGVGSQWSNESALIVGGYGRSNSLEVVAGGQVFSQTGIVGNNNRANIASFDHQGYNRATVSGTGSVWSNSSELIVGNYGSGNELMVLDGGAIYNDAGYIGYASSNNYAEVSGETSQWINERELYLGYLGNSNLLDVSNGGQVASSDGIIGFASDDNAAIISGIGSSWSNSANLYIGYEGAGNQLVIEEGASVDSRFGFIGGHNNDEFPTLHPSASNNSVVVEGGDSSWNISDTLFVGLRSSGNSLVVTNGGAVSSGSGVISSSAAVFGDNTAIISGEGSVWSNRGDLTVSDKGVMQILDGGHVENEFGVIGVGVMPSSSVLVSGVGSVWSNRSALVVGSSGSRGSGLSVSDGGQVFSASGIIGENRLAMDNEVEVSGVGSLWNNSGELVIGYGSAGNMLSVQDGGRVTSGSITIGENSAEAYGFSGNGNAVSVSGAGSLLKSAGDLNLGYNGSDNSMQIEDGGYVYSRGGSIGYGALADSNRVTVAGNESTWNAGYLGLLIPGGQGISVGSGNVSITPGTFYWANGSFWSNDIAAGGGSGLYPGVTFPPLLVATQLIYEVSFGDLAVGSSGSFNTLDIEDGGLVASDFGIIGEMSNAWFNAVSVTGSNSEWRTFRDLSLGGRMSKFYYQTFNGLKNDWVDGGRGNSLYVGNGGLVTVGRDLHNRNWSNINVDPGASINVASNYYQDATSSLRFGVETNAAGAPLNALVTVGGTAEFEKGATIEYASNVGQLQFDTFYTNRIIAADKLIVAGVEDADSLDLEMLDASGTLVDVVFWENEQDIYGLVGRNYLADTAGFDTSSMMGQLSKEIDDMSLLGDPNANAMVNLLNTMSGSQQSVQLEQQYSQGAPAYQHARSMTEGMKEIRKHSSLQHKTRQAAPTGANGPYNPEQELQGWIKPYGLWADNAALDGFSGYDQQVYGTVVGFDLPMDGALLGVAGGYGHSSLSLENGDESTAQTGYGVVYLNWGTEDWFYDVNMGYGKSKIENDSGTAFHNSSDYAANNFALQLGGGKEISINRDWIVTPKASVLWSYYYQEDYTETSTQGVERNVDAYERNDLLSTLGAAVGWKKQFRTMAIKPEARLYWLHQFNDDDGQVDYELVNGMGGQYYFLMAPPQSDVLEAGLGITCILNDELQFVIDVDGRFGEDYSAYALSGRAVIEF
ncbi:autotransporter domain-containing protein [Pontiellaceae bacterium B12219]|nr:autotransporter domain-containing protein [Pontiellaceae bacterium B12219]